MVQQTLCAVSELSTYFPQTEKTYGGGSMKAGKRYPPDSVFFNPSKIIRCSVNFDWILVFLTWEFSLIIVMFAPNL